MCLLRISQCSDTPLDGDQYSSRRAGQHSLRWVRILQYTKFFFFIPNLLWYNKNLYTCILSYRSCQNFSVFLFLNIWHGQQHNQNSKVIYNTASCYGRGRGCGLLCAVMKSRRVGQAGKNFTTLDGFY